MDSTERRDSTRRPAAVVLRATRPAGCCLVPTRARKHHISKRCVVVGWCGLWRKDLRSPGTPPMMIFYWGAKRGEGICGGRGSGGRRNYHKRFLGLRRGENPWGEWLKTSSYRESTFLEWCYNHCGTINNHMVPMGAAKLKEVATPLMAHIWTKSIRTIAMSGVATSHQFCCIHGYRNVHEKS